MNVRTVLIVIAAAAAILVACSSDGEVERQVGAAETELLQGAAAAAPQDTTVPAVLQVGADIIAAVETYSAEQGWDLVGYCFGEAGQDSANVGKYCYVEPRFYNGEVTISVGRTFSDFAITLVLEPDPDGGYLITDVISSDGPP